MTHVVDRQLEGLEQTPGAERRATARKVALGILVGVLAALASLAVIDRHDVTAGALTAESYRTYTQAQEGLPPTRPADDAGALTSESYRRYAQAREGLPPTRPADDAGALTSESYRRYAEAMKGFSTTGD